MTISMLELRRREARAHDQLQRDAEEAATKARAVPEPRGVPAPVLSESVSESDLLAALLVRDGRHIATVADLHLVFQHFAQQIEALREPTELSEIDDLHADRER